MPREEILRGTFNPEVFTASLGPVLQYYRSGKAPIDSIYTDAELFFRDATYPTQGLRTTLTEVFGRIAGDPGSPAIHRLETAFGGGKTHTLIACTHIAYQGSKLAGYTDELLPEQLLPHPGSVIVAGVPGDEIPVHRPQGDALVPYTLWGEIAYQVGGEELYRAVESEATSYAAPGRTYFERVFTGRKVIIMLDELAQYAARLEAARPNGAGQLAAFLMSLNGYARTHSGIAIILTLASAADAFSRQTNRLAKLISLVRGEDISAEEAIGLGERAIRDVSSVVARDAVQVTPVQAREISAVLAKRLFSLIDRVAAEETAAEYMELYRRNQNLLPQEACSENYRQRLQANYPFHPTLVDFLNNKLAGAENFQGTRGVLRVLALAVRSLWQNQHAVPMIHASHLELKSERVVNEILNRTGSSDLLFVLNADVGGVDTGSLEGGQSNAERADQENPHPEGYSFYRFTWQTVFLHSLVGRTQGLGSNLFGINEPDCLLAVSMPGLTPAQVQVALEEIKRSAFYLRADQGRYFASEEPTINSVLAHIRRTVNDKQIKSLLADVARKVIAERSDLFHIEHDVSLPEHIPDGKGRPILAVVSPVAEAVDVQAMITTKGPNIPREQQNLVFLLTPDAVRVTGEMGQAQLPGMNANGADRVMQRLFDFARHVSAIQMLQSKPQTYGVSPGRLREAEVHEHFSQQGLGLETLVAQSYRRLYYPSTTGHIVYREIRSASGESGRAFIEAIKSGLLEDGELLTAQHTGQSTLNNLKTYFFAQGDTVTVEKLASNFVCMRNWPVLESPRILGTLLRAGVEKGTWAIYKMGDAASSLPAEFFDKDTGVPFSADLLNSGYSLITLQGAKQRGWTKGEKIDPAKLQERVLYTLGSAGPSTSEGVRDQVTEQYGEVPAEDWQDNVGGLLQQGSLFAYQGTPDQTEKPKSLVGGAAAAIYTVQPEDVLITRAQVAEKGWLTTSQLPPGQPSPDQPSPGGPGVRLSGPEAMEKVWPLLKRLGSIYSRGASSQINELELSGLGLPAGGRLRLTLSDATPKSIQALGELLEVLVNVAKPDEQSDIFLAIDDPAEDCKFIKELNNK
jgi:hypothetical protein